MLVTGYLSNAEHEQFKRKAAELGMTEGELTQSIIRSYLLGEDESMKKLLGIVKAVNDFFIVDASIPRARNGTTKPTILKHDSPIRLFGF